MSVLLTPYPKLNTMSMSYGPILSYESTKYVPASVAMMKEQLFGPRSNLNFVNNHDGKYIATIGIYRGSLSSYEVQFMASELRHKQSEYYVEAFKDSNMSCFCGTPPPGHVNTGTLISNNTGMSDLI